MLRCATAASTALPEHAALMDGRRTRKIEIVSYRLTSDFLAYRRDRLRGRVSQMAAVRPLGVLGMVAEGFLRMVPAPFPLQVFGERGEGLRWMGCERHAPMVDELEALAIAKGEADDFLLELRRVVDEHLVDGAIDIVAKRLATSVRSLQRRLRSEGTSFQRELNAARVRSAQRLMLESDLPLARIAIVSGFGSAASFSVVFRRHEGLSPSEWRDAREPAPSERELNPRRSGADGNGR
jgi:AraC-like DNA-binding protein